jgi:uncharacterized membrane protein
MPLGFGPVALSADGGTVLGTTETWTAAGGSIPLSSLPGFGSFYATDFSADGSVIVGYSWDLDINSVQAFRWSAATGTQSISSAALPETIAFGVSADGSTVVGSASPVPGGSASLDWLPSRWTQSTGVAILGGTPCCFGSLPVWQHYQLAVSGDGSVVVGGDMIDQGNEAWRWTEQTGRVPLELPNGYDGGRALGITLDGSVAVGWVGSASGGIPPRPARWTENGVEILSNDETVQDLMAQFVSADGSVIAGRRGDGTLFIWDAQQGMYNLSDFVLQNYGIHLDGAVLIDMSADGRTFLGEDPVHGPWIMGPDIAPIPEASTFLSVAMGLVLLGRARGACSAAQQSNGADAPHA